MIKDAAPQKVSWLTTILGLMTLYFGLTGVYRQIDDALRTIWHEPPAERKGKIRAIEKRLASIGLVFAVTAVMLLSVVADAAIAITGKYASSRLVGGEVLWHAIQLLVSTLVLTVLFAFVFRTFRRRE